MGRVNYFVVNGVKDTANNHCRRYGINPSSVRNRIKRGLTPEEAFTTPMVKDKIVKYQGEEMTIREAVKKAGISYTCWKKRVDILGLSEEEALRTESCRGRMVTYKGENIPLKEALMRADLSYEGWRSRVKEKGMTEEEALTYQDPRRRKVTYQGKSMYLFEALKEAGITYDVWRYRVRQLGISPDEALFTSKKKDSFPAKVPGRRPSYVPVRSTYVGKDVLPHLKARLETLDCFYSHAIDIAQMQLFEAAAST